VGYWSTIEISIGILCACMPAIRALFGRLFPLVFGTRSGHSNTYPYGTAKSGDSRHPPNAAALFYAKRPSPPPNQHTQQQPWDEGSETRPWPCQRQRQRQQRRHPHDRVYGGGSGGGGGAEILVKNEWAVVVGTAATHSDIELVALEKQVPHFLSSEDHYHARRAVASDDQWSDDSGKLSMRGARASCCRRGS
jgi:hypothetical protein